jgi:hypothetical protein
LNTLNRINRQFSGFASALLVLVLLALMAVLLGGCAAAPNNAQGDWPAGASDISAAAAANATRADVAGFDFAYSDRDQDASYDEATATLVVLSGTGATVEGSDKSASEGVTVAEGVVTLTAEGSYIVRGELSGASLVVDAPDDAKLQVVFDGVRIENSGGAAFLVESADKVFVTLADGSVNTLSDGAGRGDLPAEDAAAAEAAAADDAADAAAADDAAATDAEHATHDATFFSHDDLTINGSGSLTVNSASAHAIVSKDDLVICGGNLTLDAATDALQGKDCVKIASGSFTITAGDDAITSTSVDEPDSAGFVTIDGGSFAISAGGDALHAETVLRLTDGIIDVATCEEGYEAAQIWLDGGQHTIVATDDGLNAAGEARTDFLLDITAGTLAITADGDGIDSNGAFAQSGGEVLVNGPTNSANSALDAVRATTSGGTMLALGAAGMAQTYGEGSTQAALLYQTTQTLPADTVISLVAADGTELFTHTASRPFSSVAFSAPALAQNEIYSFVVDGEEATSFTLSQLQATVTPDGTVSAYTGGMGGFGGFGGGGGGRPDGGGNFGGAPGGENSGGAPTGNRPNAAPNTQSDNAPPAA